MLPGHNPNRFNLGAYNKARTKPFEDQYIPEPNSGCWIWLGGVNSGGYGQVKRDQKSVLAHRLSWGIEHGEPAPRGRMVCHSCDNTLCVNPDHLFLGDALINMTDKMTKGRHRVAVGESQGRAKLTASIVISIRSDRRPQQEIANDHGISVASVSNIKARKSWRHVL